MSGRVYLETKRIDKASQTIPLDALLSVKGKCHDFVSRGALKLAAALDHFSIVPKNQIALDVGASTGGFTDLLLHRGAKKVFAVDVGTNQLAWELRNDPRVVVLEKTNARDLTTMIVPEAPNIITCDVSFTSLISVLPAALLLAAPEAWLVALIKPQFEVEKYQVGAGGIIRDPILHRAACDKVETWLRAQKNWKIVGLIPSPITGQEGNQEFLIVSKRC